MSVELLLIGASVFFLLLLSGFFSGSETALTASSRARIHAIAQNRAKSKPAKAAQKVEKLTEKPEKLIGAILLGNNLVNILASALTTYAFTLALGEFGVALATLLMTFLVLVFAEVLPKTMAIRNPEAAAMRVVTPISLITRLLSPIVHMIQLIVRGALWIFGVKTESSTNLFGSPDHVRDELRGAIELHTRQGAMERDDRDRIGAVLDLRELTVVDVMEHRSNMLALDVETPASELFEQIKLSPYTRIPLFRGKLDNIVGILHTKELLKYMLDASEEKNWNRAAINFEKLARPAWFVPETTSLLDQLDSFQQERQHFALVVDEYGALMGFVTLEDVIEEIIGDIDDETDEFVEGIKRQTDDSVIVDGTVSIRDLNRAMDWNLPDDQAVTIAGLVLHEAQAIPRAGETFTFFDKKFTVARRYRRQLTAIRIETARHENQESVENKDLEAPTEEKSASK